MDRSLQSDDLVVRPDLVDAHERAWAALAAPGTWLTGAERVAVAGEIRQARHCAVCARIRESLSPNAVSGPHTTLGSLPAAAVEVIHRVVNDPGRLSDAWVQSTVAQGMSEEQYVEIIGIVAMVMIMDTCARALGVPERTLPEPQAGEPTRYRPPGARRGVAWLPLVEPEDTVPADGPMYPSPRAGYIYRGLSLVPQSVRDYWALASAHYLPPEYVYKFDRSIRAIARPQVEVLAARVSALHLCAY